MEMLVPFSTIFLAAMTHATLQLGLGGLLLLYHASLGKHIKVKTKNLVGSYISGVGMLVFFVLAGTCFILDRIFGETLVNLEMIIVIAALIALAIIVWAFYYRHGKTTELWVPRIIAKYIDKRAKVTESNTEAFCLGGITSFGEMPFSLILILVAANSIVALPVPYQLLGVALYTIVTILPYIIVRFAIRKGQTVVDIQKWRVKNKNFFRILSGSSFFILALFLLAFEVMV